MIPVFRLCQQLNFFLLKINYRHCVSLKDSRNLFVQSLPLNTSYLFSMYLNDDTVGIGKPDGICSFNFALD